MLDETLELLKNDEFEKALHNVVHNPDKFSHEDRKKITQYIFNCDNTLAEELFTIRKVKNDLDMMKYAFHHVKLTLNNKLIYAIEMGMDAIAEKLALEATNLDFAIYKCLIMQNHDLGRKLSDIREQRRAGVS